MSEQEDELPPRGRRHPRIPGDAQRHVFQTTNKDSNVFRTWFRGEHTNFNPKKADMVALDAVRKNVLYGWEPDAPVITPDANGLIELMYQDKKVRQGKLTFIMARGIGKAFVTSDVDLGTVRAVLDEGLSAR